MDVTPATQQEVESFVKGAAARYEELGVDPAVADQLFAGQLQKCATDLGLDSAPAEPNDLDTEKVTKVASLIAQNIGRTRADKTTV